MCPRPPDHLPPIPPPPVPPPSLPLPLLFLVLVSFLGTSIRSEFVQLVQMVDLDNVTFSKSVAFTENGSLVEDIQLLDTLYSEELKKRPRARKTSAEERRVEQSRDTEQGEAEAEPEARILMVGDHSLYERFLSLYGGDEYSAYTGLSRYLLPPLQLGVFSQLDTIYGRLSFRSSSSPSRPPRHIRFRLAAPPMIILRPEDCPLRGPMLVALHANHSSSTGNDRPDQIDEQLQRESDNGTQHNGTDQARDGALEEGTEGWFRMDGLRSVQWTHRWVERSAALLPGREHVLVVTRLDLVSALNDSATQGMAYVRAICRGADSVSVGPFWASPIGQTFRLISVVEDVGGLSTATVAAHELSHSLGAFHDGSDVNANCSARQNFLMAPVSASHSSNSDFGDTFPNSFVLSTCSKRQIEQFLDSPDSRCLWRHSAGDVPSSSASSDSLLPSDQQSSLLSSDKIQIKNDPKAFWRADSGMEDGEGVGQRSAAQLGPSPVSRGQGKPGEQFDPGQQCQIVFGTHYGPCRRRDFLLLNADPCRRLWCKNRQQRRWAPCETKGFLPMMDGTHCGEGKWCISGVCTGKSKLSKRSQLAKGGGTLLGQKGPGPPSRPIDPECLDLNGSFCGSFDSVRLRSFCSVSAFARICCASCSPMWKGRAKWKN